MGGRGSGRQMFWSDITKLDDGLRLNMNKLIRDKLVKAGLRKNGTLTWTNTRTGKKIADIGYEIDTFEPADMWLRVYYTSTIHDEKHSMDYKIRLTTTTPHYGGKRFWFICPLTHKRTSVLYSPPGGKYFASRHAYNLKYKSQSEGPLDRAISRKWRIVHKTGGTYSPKRPKGMHQKTYDRLLHKFWQAEQEADEMLHQECIRRLGYSYYRDTNAC